MAETKSSGGMSFFSLLTILFIGLKLAKIINWSWWLIMLPFYGPIVFVFVAFLIYFVIKETVD